MWIELKEILGVGGLPTTVQGITKKAKLENWERRRKEGVKGNIFEYAFTSLPQAVQAEYLLKNTSKDNPATTQGVANKNYLPEVIWAAYEKATEKQRQEAQAKLPALHKLADLLAVNIKIRDALNMVAEEQNVPVGSLKRWYYKVKNFERSDWLPLLIAKYDNKRPAAIAEFTPEAWESFKADYFRLERPQFGSCYERLKRSAKEQGWVIPSMTSIKRRIEREIPRIQQTYLRGGEEALARLYPSMKRSVEGLQALEWINGDGYQHNVFVEWHNGEIVRPKTWIWQDIRTRKILAYRVDLSENSDTIRLSLMDLIYKYGIPENLTIDNTRAAANKWMTGGVKNRYRFKVKEDEVMGIIPLLGIELHWTSIQFGKGWGQAKPIERAFSHGGLGELVDKHPLLAGFYTGSSPKDKPANYNDGKSGAKYEDFILALEDGIRAFNEREGRDTEICQGVYSFSQVFERDYAKATVRKASLEQMRLLMLMSEAVTLTQQGTFTLEAGGKVHGSKNEYTSLELIGSRYKKVVVKFDPQDLHNKVWVYSLDGIFLAEALCTKALAFGDKAAGREHDKARKQFVKAQKAAAKAQLKMDAQTAARYLPEFEEETLPSPSIIQLVQQGNAVRKVEINAEDEPISESEQAFYKGLALLKQEKGIK
ncbi:transposase domain-containing protein [Histophilus somni]|uniref:transposase domain-containing protein n=1 Tax=Histophilus somni TaxID=731 RepID=UPI00094B30A6|nr:transposase domain-containing protein [Histophilus somni]